LLNDDTIMRRLSTASSRYIVQLYKLETYMGLYVCFCPPSLSRS
jgi:hypothetical protein